MFLHDASSADDRLRALQAIRVRCNQEQIAQSSLHALRDTDPNVKALAARLLGQNTEQISDETSSELESLSRDDDPDVRFESARALLRLAPQASGAALPVLLAFLDEAETDPLMLAATLNTIAESTIEQELMTKELQPRLLRFLKHDRGEVREAASLIYAHWPEIAKSNPEELITALDDVEPVVREKIAFTLGEVGASTDAIRSALETATTDEDTEVAKAATAAFERLRG